MTLTLLHSLSTNEPKYGESAVKLFRTWFGSNFLGAAVVAADVIADAAEALPFDGPPALASGPSLDSVSGGGSASGSTRRDDDDVLVRPEPATVIAGADDASSRLSLSLSSSRSSKSSYRDEALLSRPPSPLLGAAVLEDGVAIVELQRKAAYGQVIDCKASSRSIEGDGRRLR
jgi:hypothetical protein